MVTLDSYKDIYKGERCFIVGTGPSLKLEDLDKLHLNHEISFGCNFIFRSFEKTKWRPTYYCASDRLLVNSHASDIRAIDSVAKFLIRYWNTTDKVSDAYYLRLLFKDYKPDLPQFSDDITKQLYWGHTVIYDLCLQVAAYMGFSKIYLIGIDNFYYTKAADKKNHFIDNYYDQAYEEKYKDLKSPTEEQMAFCDLAYKAAEKYSREKGFRIFNATRGGALEVFERVDFDSLF